MRLGGGAGGARRAVHEGGTSCIVCGFEVRRHPGEPGGAGAASNVAVDLVAVRILGLVGTIRRAHGGGEAIAVAKQELPDLIVLDLNQHHFDSARELYGDYWLGFSEADLRDWLAAAGLGEIEVQLLTPEDEPPHFQPTLASGVAA